jgi:hypothetical protein
MIVFEVYKLLIKGYKKYGFRILRIANIDFNYNGTLKTTGFNYFGLGPLLSSDDILRSCNDI